MAFCTCDYRRNDAGTKALWYDTSTSQPCFTRDREGLSTHMAENIMDALRIDKTATAVNIGQADNSNWCTCTECSAEREKYGTNSATYIKTVNMIAEKVQAMLDKEQPGREITITFFAYLASLEPPVRKRKAVAGNRSTMMYALRIMYVF